MFPLFHIWMVINMFVGKKRNRKILFCYSSVTSSYLEKKKKKKLSDAIVCPTVCRPPLFHWHLSDYAVVKSFGLSETGWGIQVATEVTIWTTSPFSPCMAPWMASFTSMSVCRAGASSAAWGWKNGEGRSKKRGKETFCHLKPKTHTYYVVSAWGNISVNLLLQQVKPLSDRLSGFAVAHATVISVKTTIANELKVDGGKEWLQRFGRQ